MRQSVRLGSIRGVPVGAHWSTVAIFGLIVALLATRILPAAGGNPSPVVAWAVAIPTGALFLASLLAHEAAHAVVARRHGMRVKSVTLWLLGGIAELEEEPPDWRTDLRVALAGPATSFAAGAAGVGLAYAAAAADLPDVLALALLWTGGTNLLLAVFNLLPGAPLDGGRVLRAVMWRHTGERDRAARAAARAGRILGAVFIGGGAFLVLTGVTADGLWFMLLGWFVVGAAAGEEARSTLGRGLEGLLVRDVMTSAPDTVGSWTTVADCAERLVTGSRQSVFPVVGFDGQPVGVVTLRMLAAVPARLRADTRVEAVARPVRRLLAPDEPADQVLTALTSGSHAALVLDDGRLVGMVTHDDIARLQHHAALRGRPAEPPRP
jgi:Zn-dependent protease